jgi:hypothetical protein
LTAIVGNCQNPFKILTKGIQMSGTRSDQHRTRAVAAAVRHLPRSNGSDWTVGYAEGKRAYQARAGTYRAAGDYLEATGEGRGNGHGHAWVDGFKTGWNVAGDDPDQVVPLRPRAVSPTPPPRSAPRVRPAERAAG